MARQLDLHPRASFNATITRTRELLLLENRQRPGKYAVCEFRETGLGRDGSRCCESLNRLEKMIAAVVSHGGTAAEVKPLLDDRTHSKISGDVSLVGNKDTSNAIANKL